MNRLECRDISSWLIIEIIQQTHIISSSADSFISKEFIRLKRRAANGAGFSSDREQHRQADRTVIKISQMNGNELKWNHKKRKNEKKNIFFPFPTCVHVEIAGEVVMEFGVSSELTSCVTVKLVTVYYYVFTTQQPISPSCNGRVHVMVLRL